MIEKCNWSTMNCQNLIGNEPYFCTTYGWSQGQQYIALPWCRRCSSLWIIYIQYESTAHNTDWLLISCGATAYHCNCSVDMVCCGIFEHLKNTLVAVPRPIRLSCQIGINVNFISNFILFSKLCYTYWSIIIRQNFIIFSAIRAKAFVMIVITSFPHHLEVEV